MKLTELKDKQGGVNVELEVNSISEIKKYHYEKFGKIKDGEVLTAFCTDGEEKCEVSVWDEKAKQLQERFAKIEFAKIKIINGYCRFYNYEGKIIKQITEGKFGNTILI